MFEVLVYSSSVVVVDVVGNGISLVLEVQGELLPSRLEYLVGQEGVVTILQVGRGGLDKFTHVREV